MAKFAVVLCGCGRGDGSEVHESVSVLVHVSRLGHAYQCFAPDQPQADVINHHAGQPSGETRNCLVESARISRGESRDLRTLHAADYDGVLFPGGFGAAKNLCTYASKGEAMAVLPEVERVIKEFHAAGKPIGLCCIAPVLAAKVLGTAGGGPGVRVTLGDDAGAAKAVAAWGSTHVVAAVDEAVVDAKAKVATAPAYMYGRATPHEIFVGIGKMVEAVAGLAGLKPREGAGMDVGLMTAAITASTMTT